MKKRVVKIVTVLFALLLLSIYFVSAVSINEVEVNPAGVDSGNEWVEIYSDVEVDLSGWYLTDKDGNKFYFPNISITNFYVLDSLTGLVNNDENISLFNQNGVPQDNTGEFSDGDNDDDTYSRLPDNTGNFTFQSSTKGFANQETLIQNKSVSNLCIERGQNVSLNVQISGFCIEEVIFNAFINGSFVNFTGSQSVGNNYTISLSNLDIGQSSNVTWTVYTRDCANVTLVNGIESFYVNNKTSLSVFPNTPDGLNSWYISEPTFSLFGDSLVNSLFYRWDSGNVFSYAFPFGLEDIPNVPPKESAGVLDLHYFSSYACGNETQNEEIFKVDLTSPKFKDFMPAPNSIIYNNLKPEIGVYIDEIFQSNSGIDLASVSLLVDGVDVTSDASINNGSIDGVVSYTPLVDLALGNHSVNVTAFDFSGRGNSTEWSFEIQSATPFNLSVYSPVNGTYDSKRVMFNISSSSDVFLEYINYNDNRPRWKRLCKDCDSYGEDRKKTQTLKEGENNISIRAMDEFGTVDVVNLRLFVDSKKPKISNLLPRKNSVTNGSDFSIKYSEDYLESIKLFFNPNVTFSNCSSGRNVVCSQSVDLSGFDGQSIEYYFQVSDSINVVMSKMIEVDVDVTSPNLTVVNPIGGNYSDKRIPFNISISEDVTLEYIDNSDSRPRFRKLCRNCDSYGEDRLKSKRFRSGDHDLTIRAVDKAGNSDEVDISFSVV